MAPLLRVSLVSTPGSGTVRRVSCVRVNASFTATGAAPTGVVLRTARRLGWPAVDFGACSVCGSRTRSVLGSRSMVFEAGENARVRPRRTEVRMAGRMGGSLLLDVGDPGAILERDGGAMKSGSDF